MYRKSPDDSRGGGELVSLQSEESRGDKSQMGWRIGVTKKSKISGIRG